RPRDVPVDGDTGGRDVHVDAINTRQLPHGFLDATAAVGATNSLRREHSARATVASVIPKRVNAGGRYGAHLVVVRSSGVDLHRLQDGSRALADRPRLCRIRELDAPVAVGNSLALACIRRLARY